MKNPPEYVLIFIARSFGSEFPDPPAATVFAVQELDDLIEGVPISFLGELCGWHRHSDYCGRFANIAEVQAGFVMSETGTSDNVP